MYVGHTSVGAFDCQLASLVLCMLYISLVIVININTVLIKWVYRKLYNYYHTDHDSHASNGNRNIKLASSEYM